MTVFVTISLSAKKNILNGIISVIWQKLEPFNCVKNNSNTSVQTNQFFLILNAITDKLSVQTID